MRSLVLVWVFASGAALADPLPDALIAALSGDWNGDEMPDAVFLVQGADDTADIRVFGGGFRGLEPQFTVPGAVYAGPWGGQAPGLVALSDSSFAITSEQTGIGPTPWMQRIMVAYRDGGFVVAGYTYDFYDRLDPEHYGTCDVNLLSGDYTLSRMTSDGTAPLNISGGGAAQGFALQDLTAGYVAPQCEALFR